jgi:molecular chaperone HtpG
MTQGTAEKLEFQTEVKQLLHLMIHSLYSNKDIYLRELVSNASDALDKVRFQSITQPDLLGDDRDFKINVKLNEADKTIVITDNGIGMNREDLISNLGTIARSGTKAFLEQAKAGGQNEVNLIGQFGVGFYSVFMVADKVEVRTCKAGESQGWLWASEGAGDYTLEETEKTSRGTEITIFIKEEEKEYLTKWKVESIIRKYSEYVSHPIFVEEGESSERINDKGALWRQSKSDITEEQYQEFYKHISHDTEVPVAYSHNKVEGVNEYTSLLYVPKKAPYGIQYRDYEHGLKLYVKRVFIMDDCKELLPSYLRFAKGVVDSEDLPLNVSREILQNNKIIANMQKHVTKKVLSMLQNLAQDNAEAYHEFWKELGSILKEGFYMNWENLDELKSLVRFQSTRTAAGEYISLDTYLERMHPDQKEIYFISGESRDHAEASPHMEIFREKDLEVLYFVDPVDEWVTQSLSEYKEKKLKDISKGDFDLGDLTKEEKKQEKEHKGKLKDLLSLLEESLKDSIKEVRVSSRLKGSPSCLVSEDGGMSAHLEKMMRMHNQSVPENKRILELNPEHAIVKHVHQLQEKGATTEELSEWSQFLYQQALLAEGSDLKKPGEFIRMVNKLLAKGIQA